MALPDLLDGRPVRVLKAGRDCGDIWRTRSGSAFIYLPEYLNDADAPAVCTAMPKSQPRWDSFGINLHPFFANLLPEGWILQAVAGRLKASRDDVLTLLVALGSDTVGDVWLVGQSSLGSEPPEEFDLTRLTFDQVLTQSYDDPSRPLESVSIPGVQDKVSAARITLPGAVKGFSRGLLKLNRDSVKYPRLIENEFWMMALAKKCGLVTPRTEIIHDASGASGLWVERFDRQAPDARLHVEDACQLLGIYPAEKYNLSMRAIAERVREVSPTWKRELLDLLRLYAFSYLVANGDLHAKNISLLWRDGLVRLSPAYDLLSTWPYSDQSMALKLDGRDSNIQGRFLVAFGLRFGLPEKAVRTMLDTLVRRARPSFDGVSEIGFDGKTSAGLRQVMEDRARDLLRFE